MCRLTRRTVLIAALTAVLVACSGDSDPRNRSATEQACAVTRPNGDTPPGEDPSALNHGNGRLWTTSLWPDGRVIPERRTDGSLETKFHWWWTPRGELTVAGRRRDAKAPPLRVHLPSGYDWGFQPSGLIFPSAGCWEVTARVRATRLRVVMLVVEPRRS